MLPEAAQATRPLVHKRLQHELSMRLPILTTKLKQIWNGLPSKVCGNGQAVAVVVALDHHQQDIALAYMLQQHPCGAPASTRKQRQEASTLFVP